ncbi:hypothetical protein LMG28688_04312 [Paraburkholderia caffeinitolerans]|uniref:DUF3274 domain-containing protein n=1 Tax=Paraburkholderia caffeinitolerans TaxID=1723730 RepID=A0A6J5GAM7_9BURK|nr:DUF3274 domain-containing protein [Paraburkholderia caffeinitolerans]CAB3796476.1 hypothetical protein LMG28688_04312 [Paraburkholderia caffeinitolerans]
MANSSQFDGHHTIAEGAGVTHSNRAGDKQIAVPRDRPGVVIFLHGVNDPGANYDHIEQGLCEGLNERLSRRDLKPGEYGAAFAKALQYNFKDPDFDQWKDTKYDPDTYLYQRTEITEGSNQTHSMFIPFYWGYRAAPEEIKGGEKNPSTLRGQYQDIHGNRLSKHFAKGGGMFNNATTNIPAMFDPGWTDNPLNQVAGMMMSDYQYSSNSPKRHYFVLAAKRLAMLVHEIRKVDPNETVTIMAHSQGTLITLLAQAFLAEDKKPCADCVIMVDSPYSLTEPIAAQLVQPSATPYTLRGKLNTLINIVQAVTSSPNPNPPLDQLEPTNPLHGGRTGKGWTHTQATRLDKDGSTHVFAERDNRGKVYLYFCTDDTTVDLPNVQGIGTHGVPDTVEETWQGTKKVLGMPKKSTTQLKAMDALKQHRFYQRLWSKNPTEYLGGRRLVGKPPAYYDGTIVGSDRKFEQRLINAEAIVPPYAPNLYGDEGVKGDVTHAGKDKPDYVSRNTLIGNPNATAIRGHPILDIPASLIGADHKKIVDWYNSKSPDPEDHIDSVELSSGGALTYWRPETPNEIRERLETDKKAWDKNSYHSAILRDANNIRRVAALDVAIGQARSLDDPDMRRLLIAIADWKIDLKSLDKLVSNPFYDPLDKDSKALIENGAWYYSRGEFPQNLVPSTPPKMVDAETFRDREKRQ